MLLEIPQNIVDQFSAYNTTLAAYTINTTPEELMLAALQEPAGYRAVASQLTKDKVKELYLSGVSAQNIADTVNLTKAYVNLLVSTGGYANRGPGRPRNK